MQLKTWIKSTLGFAMLGTVLAAGSLLPAQASPQATAEGAELAGGATLKDERLKRELDAVFADKIVAKGEISAEVYSLTRNRTIYGRNRELALIPASAVKVFTGFAALKYLGPDHVFKTTAHIDGPVKAGVLEGNVYLRGSGDPSLVSERLFLLAEQFLRSGIRSVKGNLIVDSTAYSDDLYHGSRMPSDSDRPFNAPTSALSFNYNTTAVYVLPGEKDGAPARAMIEPDTGYVSLDNKARTVGKGRETIVASRNPAAGRDRVTISGSIPLAHEGRMKYLNVTSPAIYAGYAFKQYLSQFGVRFASASKIEEGSVPGGAKDAGSVSSLPVREIVTLMNKYSNNFIAEALVKAIGGKALGYPTSLDKGMTILQREADEMGIAKAGFRVTSPSGLNRENRMSSAHFIRILRTSFDDMQVLPELISSLPIAGRDGTLEGRMVSSDAAGRLRAKTGTLDGVSTLVGFVQARDGELLAFSLLLNDPKLNHWDLRAWQAKFGEALVR